MFGDVFALPLADVPDSQIDEELTTKGLTRSDLFTAHRAIAPHRVRMANMLRAWQLDARRAVATIWPPLDAADNICSLCPNPGRCRRWLEWGQFNDAPLVFCPNAALFQRIARAQTGASGVDTEQGHRN